MPQGVEEKVRNEARKFLSQCCQGLTEEELQEAEEEVVELIKDSIHETMQSKHVKDLEAAGEEFDLEVHLSRQAGGKMESIQEKLTITARDFIEQIGLTLTPEERKHAEDILTGDVTFLTRVAISPDLQQQIEILESQGQEVKIDIVIYLETKTDEVQYGNGRV